MKKSLNRLMRLSLCTAALTLALGKTAHAQATGRHIFVPGNAQQSIWVPIKKGEVFNATTEVATVPKHHFFTRALGVLGIAAANYQTQQFEAQSKLAGVTKRPYLVPGIGLGAGAAAMELLGSKKHSNVGLRYVFYNKDSVLVATGTASKPNKGKLELEGTAPADGFLQVSTINKNGILPGDVALDITPGVKGGGSMTNLIPTPPDNGGDDDDDDADCSTCYVPAPPPIPPAPLPDPPGPPTMTPIPTSGPTTSPTLTPTGTTTNPGDGDSGNGGIGYGPGDPGVGPIGTMPGDGTVGGGSTTTPDNGNPIGKVGGTTTPPPPTPHPPCTPYNHTTAFLLEQAEANIKNGTATSADYNAAAKAMASLASAFENPGLGVTPVYTPQIPSGYYIAYDGGFQGFGWAAGVTRGNIAYLSPYAALSGIDYFIGILSHETAHVFLNANSADLNNIPGYSAQYNAAQEYLAHSYEEAYYEEFGGSEEANRKGAEDAANAAKKQLPADLVAQLQPYLNQLLTNLPKIPCI